MGRMLWSTSSVGGGATVGGVAGDTRDTEELLKEAQAGQAQWASVAAGLYNVISQAQRDRPASPLVASSISSGVVVANAAEHIASTPVERTSTTLDLACKGKKKKL